MCARIIEMVAIWYKFDQQDSFVLVFVVFWVSSLIIHWSETGFCRVLYVVAYTQHSTPDRAIVLLPGWASGELRLTEGTRGLDVCSLGGSPSASQLLSVHLPHTGIHLHSRRTHNHPHTISPQYTIIHRSSLSLLFSYTQHMQTVS